MIFLVSSGSLRAGAQDSEERELSESEATSEDKGTADEPPDDPAEPDENTEEAPVDPTDVTDEGVPSVPVESEKALKEVEKAVLEVEESSEEGLPDEYTIEFGDAFDWMRLNSGEWLKGEFHWMRDRDFEFDSDDLDLITKEWEKVEQLHAPRIHTYAFNDGTDLVGRAVVTSSQVIVETIDGVVTRPRDELLAIVEGGRRERDWWYVRLGAGFSGSLGNTNQGSLNANFELGRADQRSVSKVTYDGTLGYADRAETVNRHSGGAEIRIYFSQRYYFVPVAGELFNDRFANIRLRATPGTFGGVHLFNTRKVDWDLETGVGYQFLRYLSTIDGVPNPQNDFFIGFRTYWDFDVNDVLDLELDWTTSLVVTTIGNTNHQGSAVMSIEISDVFDFDVSFLFFRTEQPGPRSDGTVPEKNDYQFVVGLSLELG